LTVEQQSVLSCVYDITVLCVIFILLHYFYRMNDE